MIERVNLKPDHMTILLSKTSCEQILKRQLDHIDQADLTISSTFTMRRRGVELKLHLGTKTPRIDQTLVRHIMNAHKWLEMIINGNNIASIAKAENTYPRRIQNIINLAFLLPKVIDEIASGTQPDLLTTDYLIKTGFPSNWDEQHKQFANL